MLYRKVEIKTRGESLGILDVPVYETIGEVLEKFSKPEILEMINRITQTDLMNEYRSLKSRVKSIPTLNPDGSFPDNFRPEDPFRDSGDSQTPYRGTKP